MASSDLDNYIKTAKGQGIPDDKIKETLVKSGWSEVEVDEALSIKDSTGEHLPPPPVPHFGMWVAFQYVILFVSLYISSLAFAGVAHYTVNKLIPDTLERATYYFSENDYLLRWYLASLIVAFPIFAAMFLILKRQTINKPMIKNIRARKQLIYITLTVTFLIMVIDLIKTIYDFLNGAVTTRSLANFVVTVIISGSIFLYFLFEVREDRKGK